LLLYRDGMVLAAAVTGASWLLGNPRWLLGDARSAICRKLDFL